MITLMTLLVKLIFGLFGLLFGLVWWMIKVWFAVAVGFVLGLLIF